MANSVEKLISSGCYSINEIRELLGEERVDEPFADKHFITKNFGEITEGGLGGASGGEEDGRQADK